MKYTHFFLFISFAEIAFILFIVLMVFGADKVPEIARNLGKGMRQIKNATDEIKHEITKGAKEPFKDLDVSKDIEEELKQVKDEIEDFSGSVKRKL